MIKINCQSFIRIKFVQHERNIQVCTISIIIRRFFFGLLWLVGRNLCKQCCRIEDRMTIRLKYIIKVLLHKTTGIMNMPTLLVLKRYFSNWTLQNDGKYIFYHSNFIIINLIDLMISQFHQLSYSINQNISKSRQNYLTDTYFMDGTDS